MALSITLAILWGGSIPLIGLISLAAPSFGAEYLGLMSSFHPGFQVSRTMVDTLVGTLAGIVDGAVAGFLIAWLYNWFAARLAEEPKPSEAATPMM
jgi:hypothetical protein